MMNSNNQSGNSFFTAKLVKRLVLVVKIIIVSAVLCWLGWELYKSWGKIHLINWQPNYIYLMLAGFFYIAAFIPSAVFWRYAMRSFGQSPGLYESFRAYYIGHLGKYVPGKAFAVIIRAGLLDASKTKPVVAAAAVFFETMTMMSAGAFIAALWVMLQFHNIQNAAWMSLLAAGLMIVSALPVLPPVFRYIAKTVLPKPQSDALHLTFRTLLIGWLLMIPLWLMLGLSLWAVLCGIGIETGFAECPRFVAAAAFSVVLGFITMIPGGFGVRDFALAQMLTVYFAAVPNVAEPALMAVTAAGVQRLVSIVAELVVSAAFVRR